MLYNSVNINGNNDKSNDDKVKPFYFKTTLVFIYWKQNNCFQIKAGATNEFQEW